MVQITRARIIDGDTERVVLASAFNKARDAKKTCRCHDKNCPAVLSHRKEHDHPYYSPITGDRYVLRVAAHYGRAPKSPEHAPNCTEMLGFQKFENYARFINRENLGETGFVLNLNIPTDSRPAPLRKGRRQDLFSAAALVTPKDPASHSIHQKRSSGLNNVEKLAKLLDQTEENHDHRRMMELSRGRDVYRLSDIYSEDPVQLFRQSHDVAKGNAVSTPVLVRFRPIMIGKFRSKANMTIQGLACPVLGRDGHKYHVSTLLHCGSKDIYTRIVEDMRDKKGSFLVYADKATVDLHEFGFKKRDITRGTAKDSTVFVHVRVDRDEQIMSWSPIDLQSDLAMDLPLMARPPKPQITMQFRRPD